MAENPAGALQRALIARLEAAPEVAVLVAGRVYDDPPPGVAFPYIEIGQIVVDPLRMDGHRDWTVAFGIEVHTSSEKSGKAGRAMATAICAAVVNVLDGREAEISVEGFTFDWCEFLTQTVSREADGKTHLGIVAFEAALARIA